MVDHIAEVFVGVFINNLIGGDALQVAHTHIERALLLEGKAAISSTDLMGRNPEIQKESGYLTVKFWGKKAGKVSEIAFYGRKTGVVSNVGVCRLQGFIILVDADQPCVSIEMRKQCPAVAATAKRSINIDTAGIRNKIIYGLFQQYRMMIVICFIAAHYFHCRPLRAQKVPDMIRSPGRSRSLPAF